MEPTNKITEGKTKGNFKKELSGNKRPVLYPGGTGSADKLKKGLNHGSH